MSETEFQLCSFRRSLRAPGNTLLRALSITLMTLVLSTAARSENGDPGATAYVQAMSDQAYQIPELGLFLRKLILPVRMKKRIK